MTKPADVSTAAWEFALGEYPHDPMPSGIPARHRRTLLARAADAFAKPLVDAYRDFPCAVCADSFKVGKALARFTPDTK